MHKPNTEIISWMSSFGVYRACQKGETKLKTGITSIIFYHNGAMLKNWYF